MEIILEDIFLDNFNSTNYLSIMLDFSWKYFHGQCFLVSNDLLQIQNWHINISIKLFSSANFEHYYCLQNGILWLYLLDCKMPSFGQACSMTIPMNINPQWQTGLETIPGLRCSRERILIAMALWEKLKHAVVTEIVTASLKPSSCNLLFN